MREKPQLNPLSPLTPEEERRLTRNYLVVIGIGLAIFFVVLVAAAYFKYVPWGAA